MIGTLCNSYYTTPNEAHIVNRETQITERAASRVEIEDNFFQSRPHLDTVENRDLFRKAFERGFNRGFIIGWRR